MTKIASQRMEWISMAALVTSLGKRLFRITLGFGLVVGVSLGSLIADDTTWNGGGSSSDWSDANWSLTPNDADALTFTGVLRQSNTNDLLSSVGLVTFANSGFTL